MIINFQDILTNKESSVVNLSMIKKDHEFYL